MRRMYDRSEVADPANHYTKTESDAKYATKAQIASVFNYKGTKATASALPASGNTVGDVWAVTDEGNELYAWNGTSWDDLGNNAVDYIEVDITDLLVSTEDYTMTSDNLKAWKQGRVYGVCGIISLSLAGGKSLANGTALITAIPEAYRPTQNITEHTDITYNGLRSFQLKNDGVITVFPNAIAGGALTILIHIDFVYNK